MIVYEDTYFIRAYWLALQGLELKTALIAGITLTIFVVTEYFSYIHEKKGDKCMMKNKKSSFNSFYPVLNCIVDLSANMAGGAVLTNML